MPERRYFAGRLQEVFTEIMRQKRLRLTFKRPFSVNGINRLLPAGDYELVPDDELTSEPFFPVYRQVSALIFIPPQAEQQSSIVKANADLADILAAHRRDQL